MKVTAKMVSGLTERIQCARDVQRIVDILDDIDLLHDQLMKDGIEPALVSVGQILYTLKEEVFACDNGECIESEFDANRGDMLVCMRDTLDYFERWHTKHSYFPKEE